jgi:hypothetical protein
MTDEGCVLTIRCYPLESICVRFQICLYVYQRIMASMSQGLCSKHTIVKVNIHSLFRERRHDREGILNFGVKSSI